MIASRSAGSTERGRQSDGPAVHDIHDLNLAHLSGVGIFVLLAHAVQGGVEPDSGRGELCLLLLVGLAVLRVDADLQPGGLPRGTGAQPHARHLRVYQHRLGLLPDRNAGRGRVDLQVHDGPGHAASGSGGAGEHGSAIRSICRSSCT